MAIDTLPKLNFSVPFSMTSALPLDYNKYFSTLEAAQEAAATADEIGSSSTQYYYGMEIMVVDSTSATSYVIQPDKTLKAVGAVLVGDNESIVVDGGVISLEGFSDATTGQQPRVSSDGTLEWYTPDTTTVSGLQESVGQLQTDVGNLEEVVGDSNSGLVQQVTNLETNLTNNYDTSEEVDQKINTAISSTYKAAGSVDSISSITIDAAHEGYVYNVTTEFTTTDDFVEGAGQTYPAGTNVVVIETNESPATYKLDVLSSFVDLSNYVTSSTLAEELETKADAAVVNSLPTNIITDIGTVTANTDNIVIGLNNYTKADTGNWASGTGGSITLPLVSTTLAGLMSPTDKTKLEGITAGAEPNIIDTVTINGVDLQVSDKTVDIPIATATALGVVLSSTAENQVTVESNGAMTVNNINVNKLIQTVGDQLILNGGNSTTASA